MCGWTRNISEILILCVIHLVTEKRLKIVTFLKSTTKRR